MFSIFRKKKSAAEEFAEKIARETSDEAARRSKEVVSRMRDRLLDHAFVDTGLAAFVAEKGSAFVLNLELQFLWGYFHEFVQT
ncbi:hypothetical protein AB4144_47025, partial [Rhizobiaceae sp. 2RAB30]